MEEKHPFTQIMEGLEKEWIDKACKWLEENAGSYLLYPFCEYDKGSLIKDFKKAMEDVK